MLDRWPGGRLWVSRVRAWLCSWKRCQMEALRTPAVIAGLGVLSLAAVPRRPQLPLRPRISLRPLAS